MKLFIIGNGFDLATKYKTQYKDFRNFLFKNEEKYTISGLTLLEILPKENYNFWKDFEEKLSEIDQYTIYKSYKIKKEKKIISKPFYEILEDISDELYLLISNAFTDFIRENTKIRNKANSLFKSYFHISDKYLNFNYSNTLENVYSINENNIFYIHGSCLKYREDNLNNEIVFGHSGNIPENLYPESFYDDEEKEYIYIQNKIRESLTKKLQLPDFESFLGYLGDYEEIHIIGHSLGLIDKPYFSKLCTKCTPQIIYWEYKDTEDFDKDPSIIKVNDTFPNQNFKIFFYNNEKIFDEYPSKD